MWDKITNPFPNFLYMLGFQFIHVSKRGLCSEGGVTKHEVLREQEVLISSPYGNETDVLFAQARVHCDNKPRQTGVHHDDNTSVLYFTSWMLVLCTLNADMMLVAKHAYKELANSTESYGGHFDIKIPSKFTHIVPVIGMDGMMSRTHLRYTRNYLAPSICSLRSPLL